MDGCSFLCTQKLRGPDGFSFAGQVGGSSWTKVAEVGADEPIKGAELCPCVL